MLLYLGNKLSAHGYTPTSVETLGGKLEESGLEVIAASSKKNKILRMIDMLYSVYKLRYEDTVVLIDSYSTSAFWFAYCSSRMCKHYNLPYITILRGGDLPTRLENSKKYCIPLFTESFTNVAVSGYLFNEFEKRKLPVEIIHNYIELKNYPFTVRKQIGLRLLWVRAFHKIYNPELAIDILAQIKKDFPEATLTMVGPDKDGSMQKCRQLSKALKLDVTFTGRLTKKEWIELSTAHDIFINTTNVDNTPVSVMEAMALGMPVITTDAGGIPFLFENGKEGLMVSPGSANEFIDAIMLLASDPDLTETISRGARNKAMQWDWELIKPQWISLINKAKFSFL